MISPLHASVKVLTFMVAAAVFKLSLKIIVPIFSGSVNYWFVEGGSRNMLDKTISKRSKPLIILIHRCFQTILDKYKDCFKCPV